MAAKKKDTQEIGSVWDIPSGSVVRRPDGTAFTVGPGGHVLDLEGEYACVSGDGEETTVTAK